MDFGAKELDQLLVGFKPRTFATRAKDTQLQLNQSIIDDLSIVIKSADI